MNDELSRLLELLRMYKAKGCLDSHYQLLIDYIDELEVKRDKAIDYIKLHKVDYLNDGVLYATEFDSISSPQYLLSILEKESDE